MRIKIVCSGPNQANTKILNDKGEMIEGVESCLIELVAGGLPKATLSFCGFDLELDGDFIKKEIPSEVFFPAGENIETLGGTHCLMRLLVPSSEIQVKESYDKSKILPTSKTLV